MSKSGSIGFVVTGYLNGTLIESIPLKYLSRHDVPPAIHVRDTTIYVGSGDLVEVCQTSGRRSTVRIPATVKSLGSWPTARERLFAVTESGGVLFDRSSRRSGLWNEGPLAVAPHRSVFTRDLDTPVISSIWSQWVVVAAENGLLVFRTQDDHLVPYGELSDSIDKPVAVIETSHRNQFGVLTVRGQLQLYEIQTRAAV